jgi:hypothetical protein
LEDVVGAMTETLFFFEPAEEKVRSPVDHPIPSLCTLSPNHNQTHEYLKSEDAARLYFPVWSESEYMAVGRNENIDNDTMTERYYMYGGILRHLFLDGSVLLEELSTRLKESEDLKRILLAEVTDVDAQKGRGTVSGCLVCYTDVPFDGDKPFKSKKLALTSLYVREKIRETIKLVSEFELASKVLQVLKGRRTDELGGSSLESTVASMIAGGSRKIKWEAREVETGEWIHYKLAPTTVKRVREMEISNKGRALLVSSNRNFPVVDIVDSQPDIEGVVIAYQVTWQENHPFNMGALHDLRRELKINPNSMLKICFVVPQHADQYASRSKNSYCKDFQNLNRSVNNNNEVWTNTSIYVLRPKDDRWIQAVETFLSTGTPRIRKRA